MERDRTMTVKRRTYVVGVGIGLKPDEIKVEHDLAVVHLGDPPFFMAVAPPGDKREPVIELSVGGFLTDLVWLTPKRAQGRVLFSLIEGAAEAVEYEFEITDGIMDNPEEAVASPGVKPDAGTGGAGNGDVEDDGAIDPVEDFIERVNNGEITQLSLLDFETLEDFRGVLGDEMDEDDFQHHRAVMDEIVEEARVRGIPVSKVTASADEYRQWRAGQPERESGVETIQAFAEHLRDREQQAEAG
jgi:hypothetical protein